MTVEELFEKIGRADLQKRLDVSAQVMSRAKKQNRMPANWFLLVRDMCRSAGVKFPEDLFHMKHDDKQNVDDGADVQEVGL